MPVDAITVAAWLRRACKICTVVVLTPGLMLEIMSLVSEYTRESRLREPSAASSDTEEVMKKGNDDDDSFKTLALVARDHTEGRSPLFD